MSGRWSFLVVLVALLAGGCHPGTLPVSNTGAGAYEVSLRELGDGSGFVVGWFDRRHGRAEVYMRLLDPVGRPRSREYRLTTSPTHSFEPDVAVVGDDILVAWYDTDETEWSRVKLGRWSRDGVLRWIRTFSSDLRPGRVPVILADRVRERLFIAWLEDTEYGAGVWGRWLDLDGLPQSPPLPLGPAGETTWNLNAALDERGQAWVVYDAKMLTRTNELFAVRTDGEILEWIRLTADDGFASAYPDIVFTPDHTALTWFDERDGNREVYLRLVPGQALTPDAAENARRVTQTAGESIGAYLAWNGRHIGVAWSDDTTGRHEIYFQPFDLHAAPTREASRLTYNTTASLIPSIRPTADGFAIAWNEDVVEERRSLHGVGGRSEAVVRLVRDPDSPR